MPLSQLSWHITASRTISWLSFFKYTATSRPFRACVSISSGSCSKETHRSCSGGTAVSARAAHTHSSSGSCSLSIKRSFHCLALLGMHVKACTLSLHDYMLAGTWPRAYAWPPVLCFTQSPSMCPCLACTLTCLQEPDHHRRTGHCHIARALFSALCPAWLLAGT